MSPTPAAPPPMILRGPDGSLRLSIVRYEFPHISADDEANWLLVQGEAAIDDRSWTFRDPALTIAEVQRLADWLDALALGEPADDWCDFIEPNLQFNRVSPTLIRVAFALESAPPWAKRGDNWTAHGFDVLIDDQLKVAAQGLRGQLKACPPRGGWAP